MSQTAIKRLEKVLGNLRWIEKYSTQDSSTSITKCQTVSDANLLWVRGDYVNSVSNAATRLTLTNSVSDGMTVITKFNNEKPAFYVQDFISDVT